MAERPTASREEMLACVDRELRMRERVYPQWIERGRMSARKAEHELAVMRSIRDAIAAMPASQPSQGTLFGRSS